jgi:FdrA protein
LKTTLNKVEKGVYLDSVALMRVSRRVAALAGVEAASLMIGTPSNRELLRGAGLLAPEGERAGVNDLVIAVRARDARCAQDAVESAALFLTEKNSDKSENLPSARSLAGALELLPGANLALISVPGEFAALEARKALERGLNALVFSDNVPLEDELALKRLARDKGLLMMGPDCGTALIGGTPIAFANAVPRGDIGIVSASGTGLQEVSTLIARMGGGVSHGIGVGGRDLDARIGALGMLAAIDALEADPGTRTIVLISKPPAPDVAKRVLDRVKKGSKRFVVCFLGSSEKDVVRTLRDAAESATGKKVEAWSGKNPEKQKGKLVKGLYCGGTLCSEAKMIFAAKGLKGHSFVDLGDDEFTRGRPHPMIEPELRNEHVAAALADPKVGVILLDVVLGFGSHPDPAGVLLKNNFSSKIVIASVVGTEGDPQVWSRQVTALRTAGVTVAPSNAHAAELAASLVAS